MEIVFRNPLYLWSLIVIPLVITAHYFSLRYSKGRAIKFANFVALARVADRVRITSNFPVLLLRISVFTAIVFAISGTTIHYTGSQIDADYVLAIDASASMLAEDLFPNRFEAAKDSALGFIDEVPVYSSVGVVSFSGTTYIHQPLTTDKNLAKVAVTGQEILVSGGTSIGDAVISSTNLLINSPKSRVIVVLTDGRSNLGINIENAIEYANNNNIIVNTIGLGTEDGYFLEVEGAAAPLGVDVEELRFLAESTGGTFYFPDSREDLLLAYSSIANSKKVKAALDLSFFLLIYILLALSTEWILINTRYKVIP